VGYCQSDAPTTCLLRAKRARYSQYTMYSFMAHSENEFCIWVVLVDDCTRHWHSGERM